LVSEVASVYVAENVVDAVDDAAATNSVAAVARHTAGLEAADTVDVVVAVEEYQQAFELDLPVLEAGHKALAIVQEVDLEVAVVMLGQGLAVCLVLAVEDLGSVESCLADTEVVELQHGCNVAMASVAAEAGYESMLTL
jgi:hypothetical protein